MVVEKEVKKAAGDGACRSREDTVGDARVEKGREWRVGNDD